VLEKTGSRPKLLLHSCCGPCSSYVLEYMTQYFDIGLFYFNPNIWPEEEYEKRRSEQLRLLKEAHFAAGVIVMDSEYDQQQFYDAVRGYENEPERGARCTECFRLRLTETAKAAKANGFDYFTTTLTVSPHKDSQILNKLGESIAAEYGIAYLCSDFKKRKGFDRSLELSEEYSLYRQEYCGCVFSLNAGGKE